MSIYLNNQTLFDKILFLEEDSIACADRTFRRFGDMYRLYEWREILCSWVEACLTSENDNFSEPEDRANLLVRYRHLEEVLEAIFITARWRS